MTRRTVGVFAAPYRPRRSTAAESRAFGRMAAACYTALGFLLICLMSYIAAAVLR